ncbi:MAG: glycosyltransferase family 2 protein [Spirochaetales bacterium]|nr:glycosyltransferase family 2 protein [Spirochaetales bacterium]
MNLTNKTISIIICTYNRSEILSDTLDSLLKLDFPTGEHEIIIVDDGSTDNTYRVASRYPVKYYRNEKNSGIPYTRNRGLSLSKGEIIVYLDDDCIPESGWLKELTRYHQMPGVLGIGGLITAQDTKSIISNYMLNIGYGNPLLTKKINNASIFGAMLFYINKFRCTAIDMKTDTEYVSELYGANCSFLKEKLLTVKGYNEKILFSEDIDLSHRLKAAYPGERFLFAKKAVVKHKNETSLIALIKRTIKSTEFEYITIKTHKAVLPVYPFPIFMILGLMTVVFFQPLLILPYLTLFPQVLYFWWIQKFFIKRKFYYLLFPYIQLCLEFVRSLFFLARMFFYKNEEKKDHREKN